MVLRPSPKTLPVFWFIVAAWLVTRAGSLHAQTGADLTILKSKLTDATRQFEQAKRKARANASTDFDRLTAQVKNASFSATVKADKMSELANAKKQFVEKGTFPDDAELVPLQVKYYTELDKSYRTLSKLQDQMMEIALSSNDDQLRANLQAGRRDLDAQLPGAGALKAGSKWLGTQSLANGTHAKFNLHVDKLTGSVFHASVGNTTTFATHPKFLAEGVVDGLTVKLKATKIIQGDTVSAAFSGILTGNRIVGTLDQVTVKGKRTHGIVILMLSK